MKRRLLSTIRHACGCLSQRRAGSESCGWIYCGSHDCPFDELGTYRNHKPTPARVRL